MTKQNIIQEIRQKGWWIMNEKEIADYHSSAVPENYDPDVALFLSLSYRTEVNNEWLKKIGKLTDLTSLHLDATNITDEGIAQLAGLSKLKTLNLRATNITNKSLKTISQLISIENLWLNQIQLNGENLHLLGNLKNLDSLFLGGIINDNDIEFLGKMESIRSLSLEGTIITCKSLQLFNSLPNLWYLDITNTAIWEEELIPFQKQNPKMVIHYIDY